MVNTSLAQEISRCVIAVVCGDRSDGVWWDGGKDWEASLFKTSGVETSLFD